MPYLPAFCPSPPTPLCLTRCFPEIIFIWKPQKYGQNLSTNALPLLGFFKIFYLFIFRERGREGEREGEKHQCVVASHVAPTGELAHNPGMCPDWESNWRPFGSQPALNPLSYPIQDSTSFLMHIHSIYIVF